MGYHVQNIDNLDKVIKSCVFKVKNIQKKNPHKQITIVCIGMSGLIVAPLVASKTKSNLVLVRKKEDNWAHSGKINIYRTEKSKPISNGDIIIFIDDLVSRGNTFKYVLETLRSVYHIKNIDYIILHNSENDPINIENKIGNIPNLKMPKILIVKRYKVK